MLKFLVHKQAPAFKSSLLLFCLLLLVNPTRALERVSFPLAFAYGGNGALHQSLGGGTALREQEFAAFWNPAALALRKRSAIFLEHGSWFGGVFNKEVLEVDLPFRGRDHFSFLLLRGGVSGIPLTSELQGSGELSGNNRPVVSSFASTNQWLFLLSAARKLNCGLLVGTGFKLVRQDLAGPRSWGLGLDAGILYGPRSWSVALMIRDLTTTTLFWNTGRREMVLPRVTAGLTWRAWRTPVLAVELVADITQDFNGPSADINGNAGAPVSGGVSLRLFDRLRFNVGYDQGGWRLGSGYSGRHLGFGYALIPHPYLGKSHLVTLAYYPRTGKE